MHIIRSGEDMAHAIANPPDPEIGALLQGQVERLAEYEGFDLAELAMFAIGFPGDTLDSIEEGLGRCLIDSTGTFMHPPEIIARHGGWYEATFILSDDGYGLVFYVPIASATEPRLLTACERAVTDYEI